MVLSVQKDSRGPDWPLGLITVAAAGTPVNIMNLVDSAGINNPQLAPVASSPEYTYTAQQIWFQAVKSVAPVVANVGAIYIMRKGVGGTGAKDDSGSIVAILQPGQSLFLSSAPMNRNVFSPYRYTIDADNSGDGCIVTLIIQ